MAHILADLSRGDEFVFPWNGKTGEVEDHTLSGVVVRMEDETRSFVTRDGKRVVFTRRVSVTLCAYCEVEKV